MEQSEEREQRSRFELSDALLLAVIPVLGSVVTFAYEVGALSYYGVPMEYADVTFQRIAVVMMVLAALLIYPTVGLVAGYADGARGTPAAKKRRTIAGYLTIGLGVALLVFLVVGVWIFGWLIALSTAVPLMASAFLFCLFKLVPEVSRIQRATGPLDATTVGNAFSYGMAAAILAILVSAGAGYLSSWRTTSYWVIDFMPEYLLVQKTGDTLVLKKYDSSAHRWTDEMALLRVDKERPLRMKEVNIGKLQPKTSELGTPLQLVLSKELGTLASDASQKKML